MKKSILISIGIIIILITLGVWAYLFTFGAPKNGSDVFTNFGIGGKEVSDQQLPENSTVDVKNTTREGTPQALKQLTTRPVAGASFLTDGNTIRYVEQGTGHMYSIDLDTGNESLISGTTLLGARDATFSKDGLSMAITTINGSEQKTFVGTIDKDSTQSFTGVALPNGASNIHFDTATNTLMYLLKNENGSSGYTYNLKKETGTQLFSIVLRDIRVLWSGDRIYVYTTPSAHATGYLYRVSKNNLEYVTQGGAGLMGVMFHNDPLVTRTDSVGVSTYLIDGTGEKAMPIAAIPEKCVSGTTLLFCAFPASLGDLTDFPDAWYKGAISYSDILWSIDTEGGIGTVMSNFLLESGREIDVSKIGISTDDSRIYFINKNDNTLWMYDDRVHFTADTTTSEGEVTTEMSE